MLWIMVFCAGIMAGVVNALTGFGAGIMMMTVLPSYFDMLTAPALSTATTSPINALQAWKFRRYLRWDVCLVPSLVYLVCSTLAIRVAGDMDLRLLRMALSAFLIVLSGYFLVLADKTSIRANWKSALVCSVISGLCNGWFGIGGPLMALFYISATRTKEEYVAAIQFLFAFVNILNIFYRIFLGVFTLRLVLVIFVAVLGTLAGRHIGMLLFQRIDRERLKKLVYLFIGVAGAINLAGCF